MRRPCLVFAIAIAAWLAGSAAGPRPTSEPRLVLWAWEQKTVLGRLDTARIGVAYLAGSILLRADGIEARPRFQPLVVPPGGRLTAVVRIDISRSHQPRYAVSQRVAALAAILRMTRTGRARGVEAVQIDFDAPESGRAFYADLLHELRARLGPHSRLSMTALASWCLGDPWIAGLPVDEAVPMLFRMGADTSQVKKRLARNRDFVVPACRHSLGLSVDEPVIAPRNGRRLYLFHPQGWTNESAASAAVEYLR